MGKFSTYRYLELKDDTSVSHISTRSRSVIKSPRRLRKLFIFLIISTLCATYLLDIILVNYHGTLKNGNKNTMRLFGGQAQWLDGLAKRLGYESVHHYAVIIDAGSSGSRVLAYRFRVPFTVFGPTTLDLVDEYFEQSKPGLSSYADDPAKGADTIVQLIKKAEFLTPAERRRDAPLIVRATAGLRLLPSDKAAQLVRHVAAAIAGLGYDVASNAVEIMEGSDEGIFIWYTVNLLHNLLDEGETMAALDLGGGSTQITYQLSERDSALVPTADQYVVPAGKNITLFTHSYLNLGLHAARYGIFRMEAGDNATATFKSQCVEPIVQLEKWTYANKQYTISGAPRPEKMKREAAYERCHALVRRYVLATLDHEPQPPRGRVAAMSYFYDVAADAGIIDVMKGGLVSVAQYRASAVRACSAENVDQPFACIDLVYMVALLQDAYKIKDREPISLFKKVDGHEVSWALGLAYTTVMNRIAAARAAA